MVEIIIKKKSVFVSDEDYMELKKYKWHLSDCGKNGVEKLYVSTKIQQKKVYMHRMLMNCPPGMVVDHIDGNSLNNLRSNLRIITAYQNQENLIKRSCNVLAM